MHFETGATRLWWGSSLKRPAPRWGEHRAWRELGLATRADAVCVRQGQAPFLIQDLNKAFLDLCLNEKRTGSTLCYENQILFTVKITSEDRPPLWIFQPAFYPEMYIKLVLRLGRRSIRLSSDLVLTGGNSLSLKPEK